MLGNLMQKATAFVLIPLYTNRLSTAEYGLLELANTLVNLLLVAAALGVPSAINKCYHRDCPDEGSRSRLAGTAVIFSTLTAGGLALLGWALEDQFAGLLFSSPEGLLVYRLSLVWLVLAQMALVPFELLRAAGRSHLYVGLSLVQLLTQFGCTLYLVLGAGLGLAGVLAGNLVGLVAANLAGGLVIARRVAWRLDSRLLASMVSYGVAMIPVFVSGWVVNMSDRFFLKSMVGLSALGIYALGYKFGALVDLLLVMPFQRAWTPIFFRMAGDAGAPRALARVSTYLVAGLAFCSLAVSLAVPPFLRLSASAEYLAASQIVPLVCLAYLLGGLANCLGNGLIVADRVRLVAVYAGLAALTNLVLNLLLIPWMAMFGAAVATVLAFAVQVCLILQSLTRHYPVRLEWGRLAGLGMAGLAPLAASYLLPPMAALPDIAVRVLLLAGFPALVAAFGLVHQDEVEAVARGLSDLRARLRVSSRTV